MLKSELEILETIPYKTDCSGRYFNRSIQSQATKFNNASVEQK